MANRQGKFQTPRTPVPPRRNDAGQRRRRRGPNPLFIILVAVFCVALIAVDNRAENTIVVASGANASLLPLDINKALAAIDACDLVLMQLETPMPTIEYVASLAAERGKRVVLNPAPAATLSEQLLKNLYLITPNETEAELITGIPVRDERSAEQAARTIHRAGVRHVIVTLGKKGALLCEGGRCEVIPAHRVEAVDTTAAGDVFNAGLVVALSEGRNLTDAVRFGAKAAAISVTRMGAQASAPYRSEADAFYG